MATRRRRRPARQRETILAVVILLLAALGLGAMIWFAAMFTPVERDPASGCPTGRNAPPPAHTIVLVDQTDRLDREELDFARRLVLNEYYWLPANGLLTVRSIRARPDEARDAFAVCRMPLADEVSEINDTPRAVQQDFERMAGSRMAAFLNGMERAAAETQSPILEEVLRLYRRTDFGDDMPNRRLVLISDMIQNSARFSHYGRRGRPGPLPGALREEAAVEMAGTTVRIQYVPRPGSGIQGEAHRRFWVEFFTERNAAPAIGHGLRLGEPADRAIWYDGSGIVANRQ